MLLKIKKFEKKQEKTNVVLPKAWQSVKHRNETAQAKSNYEDAWSAVGVIIIILLIAFVLLGGVSQTGVIKFIFNWSHNIGETVSGWIEGGSIVTNEDGIYYDPTGTKGDKIKDDNAEEVPNLGENINKDKDNSDSKDTSTKDTDKKEQSNNSERQNE